MKLGVLRDLTSVSKVKKLIIGCWLQLVQVLASTLIQDFGSGLYPKYFRHVMVRRPVT